jgi:hypothetical protein
VAQRKPATVNRLVDLFVIALKTIGKGGPAKWLTIPLTVEEMPGPDAMLGDMPALYVRCVEWVNVHDGTAHAGQLHKAEAVIEIVMVTSDTDHPERVLHDLAADVNRAVAESEPTLYPIANEGTYSQGYRYDADRSARSGASVGIVTFRSGFEWVHTDP